MPIYTLEDLREKAPKELRSLSDEELVREYSRRKKRPFEEVADNLGLKPSGFLSEMGRQFMGGLSVDVPRLVGQGQQFLARELPGLTEALETGAQAQAAAQPAAIAAPTSLRPVPSGAVADIGGRLREEAAKAEPKYMPDMRGRGLGQEILLSGTRAVGPVAATVPFSVVPGGMPLAVAGLFGTSQAQDTYEKLIAQGVPEDEARQASYRTGAIQGIGEGLATYVGGKLFKPLLGRVGGATTGEVVAGMTDTGILKPFAKGMATNLLVQPTTEIAQDVGTSMVEQAYGAKPEDLMGIAKQSAMGATGLTLLLGPLAFGAHVSRSNNAAALKAALSDDPTVPREIRAQAIAAVNVEAQRQGIAPRDIASWTQEQIELEDRRTDALRRMAESAQALEVGAGIEQRLGIGAPRLDEASYIQQFEEAFNEPSGQFTYETLPDGSQAPRELTMGEVINRQANTDPNAAKDLLTSNKPKTAREVLAEIRQAANDPLSPSVWRFPVSTGLVGSQRDLFAAGPEAFAQRPVRGELTSAQQAALGGTPPMGAKQIAAPQGPIDQTVPRPSMGLSEAQQFAAAGPQAQTSATIPSALVAPSGGTPATVSPSAPAAPGVFSSAVTSATNIASQWDRSNRNSRSQEWMGGAAESNPAFNAVEQEGASVPAHGMAKVSTLGQAVKDLVSLLSGGIDSKRTLYYDSLTNPTRGVGAATGTAGGVAYRDGPFIITFKEGLDGRQPTSADITGVLVNPANAELVAPLQQMFPNLVIRDYNKVSDVVAASRVNTAAKPAKTTKPTKAAAPKKPVAPSAIEQALEEELDLADAAGDATRVSSILNQVNKEKLGAEVQGAKQIKAPGRVSLSQRSLLGIRDAIFRKSGKVAKAFGRNEQKVVDAVRKFTNAYDAYLNFSTNLTVAVKKGIAAKADERMAKVDDLAKDVQNALFTLGQSLDNNAKNVEAVVRVVKDAAQRKLAKPGKTKKETLDAIESLDSVLSSGWAAAKRESFMKELPDLADVSGQQIRPSTEKQEKGETISAIEDAAENGYSNPKYDYGKRYTGLAGILQYLRFNTTPMGRVLSKALRDALVESENPAKVVFTDKGGSRYDPKTNTVYINRGEQSAEVVLHETFHAALQWFVYQNPNAPAVKQLLLSLDRALAAKGLEGKALEVQEILQELVNNKRGLDAVLELVSYTATLNDFRRAMQEIKTGDAPKSFLESVRSVWAMYKAIVRRMLGVNDTVASDVLSASMDLLEQSTKAEMPAKMAGSVLDIAQAPTEAPGILEAKVQSGKQKVTPGTSIPSSPEAAASGQNIMMSKTQLSNYTKTLLPRFTLTETLFNQLGWQDWIKYADRKWITPFNKFIQKETPNLSQAVSWFNSHYGLESNIVEMLVGMKDARRGGTAVSEKVAKYIADMPVSKSKEILSYMNDRLDYLRGIRKEPKFSGDDTYMKRLADQAIDNWWKYATEGAMSSKDRTIFAGTKVGNRWVGGLKFTEGFVFPESVSQVASASFGSRNMRELKSRRTKDEVGTDNIRFRVTVDGDPILTDKFVGIYNDTPQLRARLQAGESLSNIMPDEFISAELFTQSTPLDDKGQAMLHDPAFTWDLQKKGKTGFRFSAHYDAREAYSAKKAIDVANAFQNTMTLLANSYASNTFAKSLYDFGTTKVGSDVIRDGSAVVFDDIDQLNEAINGEGEGANFKPQKDRKKWSYEIKPDKIIRISSDEARSERTKGMFRNRNQWVMVPKGKDGEVYGALSGKIVSGSVWAAIQDASDRRPVVSIPYAADIMRFFKSVKTKYLPATWATNVATNVVFSIADDIPLSTIPHAARLYLAASMNKEMRQKLRIDLSPAEEELMVKILNSNALLGTFASDEIKKGIYEALSANLNGPERNIASRIMQMAGVDKARIETIEKLASTAKDKAVAFDNYATEWYAAQDNIFRVASVLNYLGKAADAGMEINESVVYRAGKHARQAFLDYDIDAKAIRIMRQTAFPFISFPYAATKLLGRLVVNSPWKLVNIYAAAMIMDMMLASMADDDDDETRRTGPEKYRERLLGGFGPHAYFRIPFMGDSDNPVYYHVGKYLFPSSLMDTSPNGFMGISWFPSAISPGGPYVNTILATVAGVDAFNGKPLSDSVATDYEKVIDRLTYLQSMMTPNLPLINIKETQKFADIASGRTDLPKGSTSLALARYMGLRIYNYNVDAELEKQDQAVKGIEADYKKAISKLRKKTERMEEPDWDAFYEKEDELLERMEKRIAELRGEEE